MKKCHRLGDKQQKLISHHSGGWNSKIKVLADSVPGGNFLPAWQTVTSCYVSSGGKKSEIKMSAGLVYSEASLFGWLADSHLLSVLTWLFICVYACLVSLFKWAQIPPCGSHPHGLT